VLEHIIATVVLQVAYLATGVILSLVGSSLIRTGVTTSFELKGETEGKRLHLLTTSPGLVFLTAGLVIAVLAIFRSSEFEQRSYAPAEKPQTPTADVAPTVSVTPEAEKPAREKVADKRNMGTDAMLVQLTKHRLLEGSSESRVSADLLAAATRARERGDVARAREYLARAAGLSPQVVQTMRGELKSLTATPEFQDFLRARIRLALAAQAELPLTPDAQAILATLRIHALATPAPSDTRETEALIAAMPRERAREPSDRTLQRVRTLIEKDPKALLTLLEQPEYRWLLYDEKILTYLKAGSARFFRGDG